MTAMSRVHAERPKLGSVVLRVRLFDPAEEEIGRVCEPPWPRTIRRLYELEGIGDVDVQPEVGEITVGAAIGAVGTLLHHRLTLIAWAVSAMEELGWSAGLEGADVLMSKVVLPELALEELDDHGILGPLCHVCELDERGMPVLHSSWEERERR